MALLLYQACGISRSDIFRWLKAFSESRSDEPCNANVEVPGHNQISDRVRDVTEKMLSPDQSKELFRRWQRHYGCESDLDELLATMHKHLSEAGWKLWEWIDEDLYRLEEKYWTKKQAPCGAYRLVRITVAVEAILAEQSLVKGKKQRLPKVTSELVCNWLEAHTEHDFRVCGHRNNHKAKLTSILRGLRELVKAGRLRESGTDRKGTPGKDCIFRPSKMWHNPSDNQSVTEQQGDSSATYNACNIKKDGVLPIAQPLPGNPENQTMAENKSPNPVPTPTSGRPTEPEDGVPEAPSNQIKPDQIEPENSAEAVTAVEITSNHKKADENPLTSQVVVPLNPEAPVKQEVTPSEEHRTINPNSEEIQKRKATREAAKLAKREVKEIEYFNLVAWLWAWCVIAVNRMQPNAPVTFDAFLRQDNSKTECQKQEQARNRTEAKIKARLRGKGIAGETFRLQEDPETGKILIGRYARGLIREEAVGKYFRKKVDPIVSLNTVTVAVETIEKAMYGKYIVTALMRLNSTDEKRLLAEGNLHSRTFLQDTDSLNYIRVKFKLAATRLPSDFFQVESDFQLEASKAVRILSLQGMEVIPYNGDNDRKPYWVLGVSKHECVQSPALSNLIESRQTKAMERAKRWKAVKAKREAGGNQHGNNRTFYPKAPQATRVATLPRPEETRATKYDETTKPHRIRRNQTGNSLE